MLYKRLIMENDETWATLFELVIELEKAAADFYRGLAEKFSHVPKVSEFFIGMLMDEIQHVQVATNIRGSLTPSQLHDPAEPLLLRKVRETLRCLDEDKLNSVRTLDDAYQMAHQLESSEIDTILKLLMSRFGDFDAEKRFAVLDIRHADKLTEFFQASGSAEWRKSILIRDAGLTSDQ